VARGDVQQSPLVMTFGDYLYDSASVVDPARPGHAVQVTLSFNNTTRAITNAVVWRAANCRWTKIAVGLGADGTPDTATRVFNLSTLNDATRTVTAAQMAAAPWNVTTVEQFLAAGQITAAL
jgi:hypothetical protein